MSETQHYLPIKEWAEDDRPREKLLIKGRNALSDAELIAILIGSGTKSKSAVEVSKEILASIQNNLNELGKLSINDLTKFSGIGDAKAITIAAALELGRRRKSEEPLRRDKILSSKNIFDFFYPHIADLPHEEFWILFLNRASAITGKANISKGGVKGTIVDIKMVLKTAIEHLAASIVLCHNHPSGSVAPSQQDIIMTRQLKESCALLDVEIIDHVIIGGNSYYSFADDGKL